MRRIVIDTETLGDINNHTSIMVYDLGYVVLDHDMTELFRYRCVIKETFCDRAADMLTAYYSEKLPAYHEMVCSGELPVVSFLDAWQQFKNICKTYEVKELWAHNAAFDRNALNNTLRTLSNGFCSFFAPYGIKWCCTCAAGGQTICNSRRYFDFCENNGFVSSNGNIRTTAEAMFAYINNDPGFVEEHTALADALIEAEILRKIKKQHKKTDATPSRMAWRYPQAKYKAYCSLRDK